MTSKTRTPVRALFSAVLVLTLASCAGTQTTVTHPLSETADAPYDKILVVSLFSSFEARRWLETEIVKALSEQGVTAVRSTSMMNTLTPVVPQTFIDMVNETGADAVVLTQLTSLAAEVEQKSARPQATYNYWPTHYWNVFEVEVTEYSEPPRLNVAHSLVLATQVFSVASREAVWGMDSRSKFVEVEEDGLDYQVFVNEARGIVRSLSRDGLIAR
jgi:hypothetical protein